eukprot:gene3123-2105_t
MSPPIYTNHATYAHQEAYHSNTHLCMTATQPFATNTSLQRNQPVSTHPTSNNLNLTTPPSNHPVKQPVSIKPNHCILPTPQCLQCLNTFVQAVIPRKSQPTKQTKVVHYITAPTIPPTTRRISNPHRRSPSTAYNESTIYHNTTPSQLTNTIPKPGKPTTPTHKAHQPAADNHPNTYPQHTSNKPSQKPWLNPPATANRKSINPGQPEPLQNTVAMHPSQITSSRPLTAIQKHQHVQSSSKMQTQVTNAKPTLALPTSLNGPHIWYHKPVETPYLEPEKSQSKTDNHLKTHPQPANKAPQKA